MPPRRYNISRRTIIIDRLMNHFIKFGGLGIIAAVSGIFVFIVLQILPLFRSAQVRFEKQITVAASTNAVALGVDEWTEKPFLLRADGSFDFLNLSATGRVETLRPAFAAAHPVTALAYSPKQQQVVMGTADGQFSLVNVSYSSAMEGAQRRVSAAIEAAPLAAISTSAAPIRAVACGIAEDKRLVAGVQEMDGHPHLFAMTLVQKHSLMGGEQFVPGDRFDLGRLDGAPVRMLADSRAEGLLVALADGRVLYFFAENGAMTLRQTFRPFANDDAIANMDYLLGDDSVMFTSHKGHNAGFSLFVQGGLKIRLYGQTKTLPDLPAEPATLSTSLRNKAFLVTAGKTASLRFSTTETIRWQQELPFAPKLAAIGGKFDALLFLDETSLHVYRLHDPHPEAGLRAYFGKIWYEGADKPAYTWQSTGSTDEFEPKLSMVPLIIGTLKGTLYAMIFSVPLALLAAFYTSQFAQPRLKRFIKPTMEIMASLPSVILGFLTALWLAPLLEDRVPSILLVIIIVPLVVIAFGAIWSRMPYDTRRRLRSGHEFLVVIPLALVSGWLAWRLGPWFETHAFIARDLSTGAPIANFPLWWTQTFHLAYEQRNSLIVGFMMGFAVIPIIFTISEDALSNVPSAFRSASLALGASRWQTATRVILPTASAGIFSALMIGFGRAVGETMIVLMATGNTPIMDYNIFSGMRTLSANIAVELSEAPEGGTLFRSLYLGALMLFMLTFIVNTFAEILRNHLREKYKAV